MEFLEVIKKRRSTRQFSIEPVPKNLIEEIIESARLAPSAKNRQNWLFVVLKQETKEKITNIMLKQFQKELKFNREDDATIPYRAANSVINSIRVIKEAPILILVFRKKDKEWMEGDYLSIGAAIENLCLRATDLGLATLWIRDVIYTKQEIQRLIVENNKELISAVAVGYSTEYPYDKKKKTLKDIMIWK